MISAAVKSPTVTLKVVVAMLPQASVAVHVTVVMPGGNNEPDAGVHVGVMGPSTVSEADAENVTEAPDGPVASAVMSAGTVTVGGVVSAVNKDR